MFRLMINSKRPMRVTLLLLMTSLMLSRSGLGWMNNCAQAARYLGGSTLAAAQATGQWMRTSGPLGDNITALLNNGTNLFAATDWGGVYRSSDQGQSWVRIGPGNTNVRALVSSGANLFIGTNNGVFRSTSSGQNLTLVNSGLTDRDVIALAATNTALFAATRNEYAIFRSTDNGQSWTRLDLPDTAAGFRSVFSCVYGMIKGQWRHGASNLQ